MEEWYTARINTFEPILCEKYVYIVSVYEFLNPRTPKALHLSSFNILNSLEDGSENDNSSDFTSNNKED